MLQNSLKLSIEDISFYKVVILIDLDVHDELGQKLNYKTSLGMWETLSGDGGRLCMGMVGDTLYMSPTIPRQSLPHPQTSLLI